ncbi:MAG: T9SS type A sorting domain-containing protein, partial [Cryomorphaceae bacterium]|nr:T9SS type A sorting domain-containing protein [Cryomorphaceae bacterium]
NISEVYPVPATDKILLKGITSGNYTIRDLRGTCVAFGIISSDQSEIQISHLASGSYLLELEDQVWRFIKE